MDEKKDFDESFTMMSLWKIIVDGKSVRASSAKFFIYNAELDGKESADTIVDSVLFILMKRWSRSLMHRLSRLSPGKYESRTRRSLKQVAFE